MNRDASTRRRRVAGLLVARLGGTASQWFASLSDNGVQIKVGSNPAMVKTLRNWLEAHQLFAIVTGVLGAIVLLALILVVGGYLIVSS
jgi:hypothetical protein